MHLADGILTNPAWALGLNTLGAVGVGVAVHKIRGISASRLSWAGTLGAFVLAAQAINLPVAAGVSAHAIGTGLVTLVLGPSLAVAVLACVLMLQALLLADGGLTVAGINLLTIAILPALSMSLTSKAFGRASATTAIGGTVLGSLISSSCLATALVLGAGSPTLLTFSWLVGIQTVAGLAEGTLTWLALRKLKSQAPLLVNTPSESHPLPGTMPVLSLQELEQVSVPVASRRLSLRWAALALVALVALPPLASSSPDALEVVVERLQTVDP